MLNCLLEVNVGFGLLVFSMGILVVFAGIAVLILAVTIMGFLLKKTDKAKKEMPVTVETAPQKELAIEEGISTEIKAAIVAAVTAYYFESGSKCEFKLKQIKRI